MDTHEINLAGRISHFFAVNRPLSLLLLVAALMFGLAAFFLTPKQYNPEITRPAFAITVVYDGATVEGAIDRVVYELVEKVDTVPGVDDIYTRVDDGATITTTVIFEVGYDAMRAKLDLLSQLEQHSYLARGNINTPQVLEIDPETIPVLQIAFGSNELSIPALRERVFDIAHRLGALEGVSELKVYGGYPEALVVEPDPARLREAGVSVSELTGALSLSQVYTQPSLVRTGSYVVDALFDGVARTSGEVGEVMIRDGVRVRDVARVYVGVGGERSYVLHHSATSTGEVVMLSVAKVEGESAPVVSLAVRDALATLMQEPGVGAMSYRVVGDDGVTAQLEIMGLTVNLLTSIAIVAAVLLLFLSVRAALVVLVAIPVTLVLVFGLGLLFDQTINRITLFALILSLGLLVDSAIVATENIYAHLKRAHDDGGGTGKERVIAAAIDEVGVGLLLSTITSVIVFLPMHFITGMMGPYMGPIAFFVPAALVVSFLVAIVVTPFIAYHILHVSPAEQSRKRLFVRAMDALTVRYTALLRRILYSATLQRRVLRAALFMFLVSLVLPLAGLVHFQMLPKADRDQFYVYLDLPVGTDREVTRSATLELADVLLADTDVLHVQLFVATPPILDFNGMFKGAQLREGAEQATLRVNLTASAKRDRSSTDIATDVRAAVAETLPTLVGAVRIMEEPPGPPVRATFVAKVMHDDASVRGDTARDLAGFVSTVSGVVDVYEGDAEAVGRVRYVFDRTVADAHGVSADSVAEGVRLLGGSVEVGEFLGADAYEYAPMVLSLPAAYRSSPDAIDLLTVHNGEGEALSLRSVLRVEHELRPSHVELEDVSQLSYVTAEVEGRSIVYVVIELMRELAKGSLAGYTLTDWSLWGVTLEDGAGHTVEVRWGGEWEMTLENFRDLGIAMGVALLLVYALLVAQYGRFNTPAYILVTVPLGLVGILWGFLVLDQVFGIYLTATALIGFIALIGIVVNNAIIYLEYVEQARKEGAAYREALIQAGEARLRPIFLTSLTTVLGSLTIAADPVWSGLAWAIVFGLSLSTVLTLVIYPTLLARFTGEE